MGNLVVEVVSSICTELKFLSFGGRITLLKATLMNFWYTLFLFQGVVAILERIERLQTLKRLTMAAYGREEKSTMRFLGRSFANCANNVVGKKSLQKVNEALLEK